MKTEAEMLEPFETCVVNVGMLRQWLNEDCITDYKKMITNEDIIHWLKLKLHEKSK